MDTATFTHSNDGFPLLDLTARFSFKTASSISFDLGRMEDVHLGDAGEFVIHGFKVIGWLDVHHPCDGCIKAQIRICLPVEYHPWERMEAMIKTICEVLSISPEEHCQSTFFDSEHATAIIPKVYFGMG